MKVLLLNPCEMSVYEGTRFAFKRSQECLPPLNLAVLAGALRPTHEVRAIDLQVEADPQAALSRAIETWRPEMVGITFKTPLYDHAELLAAEIRRLTPSTRIVGGGVHATNYPVECLTETEMDVIVIGEGDATIRRLADGAALEQVPGIAFKRQGRIVRTSPDLAGNGPPPECLIADLDQLPFPDWSIFDLRRYARSSRLFYDAAPVGFLETSRGCPARCVFCSKGVYGSTWRAKSPERVLDEMERLLAQGFCEIEIVDDSFTTDLGRAAAICEGILRRKLTFPWCCRNGLRTTDVTEGFLRLARRAGLHLVAFGFESGNHALLADMKKGATMERGRDAARWARRAGMTVMGYFLMGLPGETEHTLQETIDYACSLDIDFAKYNLAIPLPGTPLHALWKDRIKTRRWSQYNFHSPARELYDHPQLDWDTLEAYLRRGYRQFYARPGYLARQFGRAVRQRRILVSVKTVLQMMRGRRSEG